MGHATQVATLVAAGNVEYVLLPQAMHDAEPMADLYLPATQAIQSPLVPVYPALHIQLEIATLPATWTKLFAGHCVHADSDFWETNTLYLPAPQSVHAADPVVPFHCPALHAAHALPSGPVYPVLHVQAARTLLPRFDTVLLGQDRQVETAIAATVVEYVCMPQSVQAAEPEMALYLPAVQPTHGTVPPPLVNPVIQMHAFTLMWPTPTVIVCPVQLVQA